jgi:hypothetical protein
LLCSCHAGQKSGGVLRLLTRLRSVIIDDWKQNCSEPVRAPAYGVFAFTCRENEKKGVKYMDRNERILEVAVRMARMWGIMECLEENFTPLENPKDVTLWEMNRKKLLDWAEEFCKSSGMELYEFFLQKADELKGYGTTDAPREKQRDIERFLRGEGYADV